MKHIAIGLFILLIMSIMGYLWYTLHELRKARYGRCWPLIRAAIEDRAELAFDDHYQAEIRQRSELDLHILQDHILNYKGFDPIDEEIDVFDKESDFFVSFKERITPHWHFGESPLVVILEDAIYAYNIDTEYTITPRQFMDYLGLQFDYYFTSKL